MANQREVSFTIRAKDAASAVATNVEKSVSGLLSTLGSFKGIFTGFTFGIIAKDILDLGTAADKAFRRIAASLPTGVAGMRDLRNELNDLADESGRSREEIRDLAIEIGRLGVSGAEELAARAKAITEVSDATGAELKTVAGGLDQIMDAFNLNASEAEETLANLVSAAKGRVDVESLFETIATASPRFRALGIDVSTATRAIIALLDQGRNARNVKSILESMDASGIREIAAGAKESATALRDMRDAANLVRDGADRVAERLKSTFSKTLEDLGTTILPAAIRGMETLIGLMGGFDEKLRRAQATNIVGIGKTIDRFTGDARSRALDQVNEGVSNLMDRAGGMAFFKEGLRPTGTLDPRKLKEMTREELEGLRAGLLLLDRFEGRLQSLGLTQEQFSRSLAAVAHAIKDLPPVPGTNEPPPSGTGGGGLPLTSAEKDAVSEVRLEFEKLVQSQADGSATSKQFAKGIAEWEAAAKKAKLPTAEVNANIILLNEALSDLKRSESGSALVEWGAAALRVATGNVDPLTDAIRQLDKEWSEATKSQQLQGKDLDEARANYTAIRQALVATRDALAKVDEQLVALDRSVEADPSTGVLSVERYNALERAIEDQIAALGPAKRETKEYQQLQSKLAEIEEHKARAIAGTTKEMDHFLDTMEKGGPTLEQRQKAIRDMADNVATLARSAIAAAEALGLMDDRAVASLHNVVSLGEGIVKALSGNVVGGIGQALTSAAALAKGLFGGSNEADKEAERERQRVITENTDALRRLTEKAGLLGGPDLNQGGRVSKALDLIQTMQESGNPARLIQLFTAITGRSDSAAAKELFEGLARDLDVDLTDDVASWNSLVAAIKVANEKLAEFDDTFSAWLDQTEAAKRILGDPGPAANLGALLDHVVGIAPGLKEAFAGIDATTAEGRDQLREAVRDVFRIMESGGETIDSDFLGSLGGGELLGVLETIIGYLDELGVSAAPTLADALSDLAVRFEILGTEDPATRLAETIAKMGEFAPALDALDDGLDLTTGEGLEAFTTRLRALYETAIDGGEGIELGSLSLEELIQAIAQLASGASSAASGIKTAAQLLAEAEGMLQTDFEIFDTDAAGQARQLASLFGFDLGDISTAGGRDAAIAALQQLYQGNRTDPEKARQIAQVIRSLRGIGFEAGGASIPEIGAGSSGSTSFATPGFQALTTIQGDRLLDLELSQLSELRKISSSLASFVTLPSTQPIRMAIPSFQAPVIRFTNTIIVNAKTDTPKAMGEEVARAFTAQVDRELGQSARIQRLYQGDIRVPQ